MMSRPHREAHTYAITASKSSQPSTLTMKPLTHNRVHNSVVEMTMNAMLQFTSVLPWEPGGRSKMVNSIGSVELLMIASSVVVYTAQL